MLDVFVRGIGAILPFLEKERVQRETGTIPANKVTRSHHLPKCTITLGTEDILLRDIDMTVTLYVFDGGKEGHFGPREVRLDCKDMIGRKDVMDKMLVYRSDHLLSHRWITFHIHRHAQPPVMFAMTQPRITSVDMVVPVENLTIWHGVIFTGKCAVQEYEAAFPPKKVAAPGESK